MTSLHHRQRRSMEDATETAPTVATRHPPHATHRSRSDDGALAARDAAATNGARPFICVDPRTGGQSFSIADERTGTRAEGYFYSSDNDPRYQSGHGGRPHATVRREVFMYSASSPFPPQGSWPPAPGGEAATGRRRSFQPHENGPEVEEVMDDGIEQVGVDDDAVPDATPHPHRPHPGSAVARQPVVEEPEEDGGGENDIDGPSVARQRRLVSGDSRRPRSGRRGDATQPAVDFDPWGFEMSPFMDVFAAMHADVRRMQQDMFRHARFLASPGLDNSDVGPFSRVMPFGPSSVAARELSSLRHAQREPLHQRQRRRERGEDVFGFGPSPFSMFGGDPFLTDTWDRL